MTDGMIREPSLRSAGVRIVSVSGEGFESVQANQDRGLPREQRCLE